MLPQLSVVTLGVRDVEVSYAFYGRLGWNPVQYVPGEVVFFQVGHGILLSFFRSDHLAAESGATGSASLAPFTLAHNVGSPKDVDAILHEAAAAGGSIAAPGMQMSWGGYSGYFTDPDGFRWEICHNPGLRVAEDGTVSLSALDPGDPGAALPTSSVS
ncbi:VOC family protein [Arthrobacter citreus]|uniref:VOC family protein n=1 Tax=Arthrobacter citreus TaxID=1670 RepID=UPI00382A128E